MLRYYFDSGCLNISVPFKAHPWNSGAKVEWWILNNGGFKQLLVMGNENRSFIKRENSTDLTAVLGKIFSKIQSLLQYYH